MNQWTKHNQYNRHSVQLLADKIQDFSVDESIEKRRAVFQEFYGLVRSIKGDSFEDRREDFCFEDGGFEFEYVVPWKRIEIRGVLDLMTSRQTLSWQGFVPDPNITTTQKAGNDTSLLHYAAQIGDHRSFIYLIEKGAEMDLRDSRGNLAFDLLREIKPKKIAGDPEHVADASGLSVS